jgi:hypothetical protein
MSWKSIVTAGLLCVLASPVFADPALVVTGSRLNRAATPTRVWNISVSPDLAISPGGSPLAVELGFRAIGGNIISASAARNMPSRVEHANDPNGQPGNAVFGWETNTDLGGGNMKPVGVQVGTGANADEAVAFLGTADFTTGTRQDLLTIITEAGVTSLEWGGRFNPDGTTAAVGAFLNGRIAHVQGTSSANFHSYDGALAQNAAGATRFLVDMNGDGNVNFGDLAAIGQAITNPAGYATAFPHLNRIDRGDANGDGNLNFGDLAGIGQILTGAPGAGASLAAASAVPEPATYLLVALGMSLVGVLRRRSR